MIHRRSDSRVEDESAMSFNLPLPPHAKMLPPAPESRATILRKRILTLLATIPSLRSMVYPSQRQAPFYKTNEFWGAFTTTSALALAAGAFGTTSHLTVAKWLLVAAWPFAAITCWCLLVRLKKPWKALGTALLSLVIALLLGKAYFSMLYTYLPKQTNQEGSTPATQTHPSAADMTASGPPSPATKHELRTAHSASLPPRITSTAPATPSAPVVDRQSTPKYQALALSKELSHWLDLDEMKAIPDHDKRVADIAEQYPLKFGQRITTLSHDLASCGADTAALDRSIAEATDPSNITMAAWEAIPSELDKAAYDVPADEPECGTAPNNSSGFKEDNGGNYTLKMSGFAESFAEDQLLAGTGVPIGLFGNDETTSPGRMYLRQGRFYLDLHLFSGMPDETMDVVRDEVNIRNPYWDKNFNGRTLEVANQRGLPVLQMAYDSDSSVRVNAILPTKFQNKVMIVCLGAKAQEVEINPTLFGSDVSLPVNPIFKYPSWKYPHEYAKP